MGGGIIASLGAFKTMFDMAKALKDMNDAAIRNGAVIELQKEILTAQAAQSDLVEYVRQLEEEVTSFEDWNIQKIRYELKNTPGGGLAWFLKEEEQGSETPHKICTKCYEERKRSILQPKGRTGPAVHLSIPTKLYCPACKSEILA